MTDLAGLNIKYLPGVGPKRAELLNKELEIFTYLDLLHYYPYKYIDRSKTYKINEIDGSMPYIQLRGKIVSYTTHGEGARRRLTALFSDGSGVIELVWFKGIRYITDRYKPGTEYTLFGKPTLFNGKFNIAHPELDPIDDRIDRTTRILYHDRKNEKCFPQLESHTENGIYPSLRNTKPTARNIAPSHYLANATHEFDRCPTQHSLSGDDRPPEAGRIQAQIRRVILPAITHFTIYPVTEPEIGRIPFRPYRELFQRLLSSSAALRTHPSSKTSHQRDSSRYGQRQTNEQTVTGRCRQWKNTGRTHEYAHRRRQRLPSLSNGSHRNIGHPALRRAEKDGGAVRTTY